MKKIILYCFFVLLLALMGRLVAHGQTKDDVWVALDRLILCESSGKRLIKVLDKNSRYSYSSLMFQRETFDSFGEKYGLPHNDIYSRGEQIAIAKRMLEEPNGWKNWYRCSVKNGVDKMSF